VWRKILTLINNLTQTYAAPQKKFLEEDKLPRRGLTRIVQAERNRELASFYIAEAQPGRCEAFSARGRGLRGEIILL